MKENSFNIAMFIDLDNFVGYCIAIGLRLDLSPEIAKLKELGKITIRRSFGDIYKLPISEDKKRELRKMLQNNLIQHEDIPYQNAFKNSSDMRLVIDALSTVLSSNIIDAVAIVASDRDYLPLFAKLREIGIEIIGIGGNKDKTPDLYIKACDYFYYHEHLANLNSGVLSCQIISEEISKEHLEFINSEQNNSIIATEIKRDEAVKYLIDAMKVLESKGNNVNPDAVVIQMIRRLNPDFDFAIYGFKTFKELCKRAQDAKLINIKHEGDIFNLNLCSETEPSRIVSIPPSTPSAGEVVEIEKNDNSTESVSSNITEWCKNKLKVPLPDYTEREMIYNVIFNVKFDEITGITLIGLTRQVEQGVSKSDVAKKACYKILYGLYREGCFSCSPGKTPFIPIVHSLNVSLKETKILDEKFILYVIRLYIREHRTSPDPEVWSDLFFGSDSHTDFIKDIYRSLDVS